MRDWQKEAKEILTNFTDYQLEKYIQDFSYNDNGDIIIPYEHKGYTVNDREVEFGNIKAISMFSGAGGLTFGFYYNLVNNTDDCNVTYVKSNKKIYKKIT